MGQASGMAEERADRFFHARRDHMLQPAGVGIDLVFGDGQDVLKEPLGQPVPADDALGQRFPSGLKIDHVFRGTCRNPR